MIGKLLLYEKITRYEEIILSGDLDDVMFLFSDQEDAVDMRRSYREHFFNVQETILILNDLGVEFDHVRRGSFIDENKYKAVLSSGGDGTFLSAGHHLSGIPLLAQNTDDYWSVGHFCSIVTAELREFLESIESQPTTTIHRLKMKVANGVNSNGGPKILDELIINDIMFAHHIPQANTSFRYWTNKDPDPQFFRESYGVLVCTAAGSTASMKNEGGIIMPLDQKEIQYHIRGNLEERDKYRFADTLYIQSLTPTGKIYVDGKSIVYDLPEGWILELSFGEPLTLLGDISHKRAHYFKSVEE